MQILRTQNSERTPFHLLREYDAAIAKRQRNLATASEKGTASDHKGRSPKSGETDILNFLADQGLEEL